MIYRLLFVSIIMAIVILVSVIKFGENFIYIIIPCFVSFMIYCFWEIYTYGTKGFDRHSVDKLEYKNLMVNARKVSYHPSLLNIGKYFTNEEKLYFDDNNIYIERKDGRMAKISYLEIYSLEKTKLIINKSAVWRLKIIKDNVEIEYRFINNYSVFNRDFREFYRILSYKNPKSVKSKFLFF